VGQLPLGGVKRTPEGDQNQRKKRNDALCRLRFETGDADGHGAIEENASLCSQNSPFKKLSFFGRTCFDLTAKARVNRLRRVDENIALKALEAVSPRSIVIHFKISQQPHNLPPTRPLVDGLQFWSLILGPLKTPGRRFGSRDNFSCSPYQLAGSETSSKAVKLKLEAGKQRGEKRVSYTFFHTVQTSFAQYKK